MELQTWEYVRRVLLTVLIASTATLVAAVAVLATKLWLLLFAATLFALLLRGLSDRLAAHSFLGPLSALAVVVVLLFGAVAASGALLSPSVVDQVGKFARLLPPVVDDVRAWVRSLGAGEEVEEQFANALQEVEVVAPATDVASSSFQGLFSVAVVLIAGVYLAVNPKLYVDGLVRLMPVGLRSRTGEVLREMGHTLQRFLVGRVVSMIAVGVITGVGLELLGIPLAALLGVVAGLFTFVPYAGPIAAALPIALVAITEGVVQLGYAMLLYSSVQMIEGFLITPLVQERVVHLPPVTTLAAEILFGILFGPLGIIISVPLAAAVLVFVRAVYVNDLLEGQHGPKAASEDG